MVKEPHVNPELKNDVKILSTSDKKILKILLNPNGRVSSDQLAKKTGLPRSTIQRRRIMLEKRFLQLDYKLKLEELGFRRVDFLISTQWGLTVSIGLALLKRNEVVYVGRSVGQHTIDLKAELIIKTNAELLDMLEIVKSMEGVRAVEWTEIVETIGQKKSIPSEIIDRM
jgi:DNA-binding Lrp family transcriptional regulator